MFQVSREHWLGCGARARHVQDIADVPAYHARDLTYRDLCQDHWLWTEPALFYGFWGSCYNTYRETTPHQGCAHASSFRVARPPVSPQRNTTQRPPSRSRSRRRSRRSPLRSRAKSADADGAAAVPRRLLWSSTRTGAQPHECKWPTRVRCNAYVPPSCARRCSCALPSLQRHENEMNSRQLGF